jgi:ABC-type proline/glycine betaine transport system permease subunit
MYMANLANLQLSLQTIAVQTFLVIWWLKDLDRTISALAIVTEVLFVTLFVAIGFGVHTHPNKEFYSVPAPV